MSAVQQIDGKAVMDWKFWVQYAKQANEHFRAARNLAEMVSKAALTAIELQTEIERLREALRIAVEEDLCESVEDYIEAARERLGK